MCYQDIEPTADPYQDTPFRTLADDLVNVSFICDIFFHDFLLELIYFLFAEQPGLDLAVLHVGGGWEGLLSEFIFLSQPLQ